MTSRMRNDAASGFLHLHSCTQYEDVGVNLCTFTLGNSDVQMRYRVRIGWPVAVLLLHPSSLRARVSSRPLTLISMESSVFVCDGRLTWHRRV